MRKFFLSLIGIIFFIGGALAQTSSIKGTIADTLDQKKLPDAVIALLSSEDSVLLRFTRADKDGNFRIDKIIPGNYVLLVTYPKFADYADKVIVPPSQELNLGAVALTQKSVLLSEFIVRSNMAMRIKGDTTEFTADSFKVKEGATVEDLLKQLPGMQVNSKGEITSQGKRVDKVLVDGEEFFGADPTIATQNIESKAVDKVQVYDTKTEQDQLKGIGASGDGNKTLNIKLKENAKKGYFGNITGSSDFKDLWNAKVMLSQFKGNRKFSVYGTKSNINTGALGYAENNQLGLERDIEYDEISGVYYSYGSGSDDFSDWNLRGLPDAYSLGALYGDKWKEEKQKINLYYLYNRLGTTNTSTTISQTLLQDKTTNFSNATSKSTGLSQRHTANAKYEWKIDSFATIKYTGAGTYSLKNTYTNSSSETSNDNTGLQNDNTRINDQQSTKKQLDNILTYTQLFRKKDRKLITTLRFGFIDDNQEGLLISTTNYYKNNVVDSVAPIDQLKRNSGNSTTAGAKITFNEPLNKEWNLVTEYSYNGNNSTSHRNSFNKDVDLKYSKLDTLFSNNFDLSAFSNSGTVTARYIGKKLRGVFGAGVSAIQLNLNNLDSAKKTRYNFTGFTPQTQVSYMFKPQTSLSFSYRGSTMQPTLSQLQPLRDNSKPLDIYIGNPDLKVGFRHSLSMSFYDYKVLKGRYIYGSFSFNFLSNAIANSSTIERGKTTNTPVNVNGNNSWYSYIDWSSGQGDKKLIQGIDYSMSGGRNVSYLNGEENVNTYTTFELYYGLRYNVTEKWGINLSPRIQRNISKSSLNSTVNNNYWSYGGRGSGFVMFPGNIELNSDIDASFQQKTTAFTNPPSIIVWNAELKKKFFKKKTLEFALVAHDILNQNIGFSRTINSNFMSEERFDRISRYFLLRIAWTFNKMPGSN